MALNPDRTVQEKHKDLDKAAKIKYYNLSKYNEFNVGVSSHKSNASLTVMRFVYQIA